MMLLIISLILLSLCFDGLPLANTERATFSIDLIHRDSILSPLYDSSLTSSERLKKTVLRSFSPINDFNSSLHIDAKYIETLLTYDMGDYLMRLSIGNGGYQVFALVSTSSDLIWVNCDLSKKERKDDNPPTTRPEVYIPRNSDTYHELPYTDRLCTTLSRHWRERSGGECRYDYTYMGGGATYGILSTETFNLGFGTNPPKLAFGCSDITDIDTSASVHGFVGLGGGDLSLTSQLSNQIDHKFSYCLVPRPAIATSVLRFGYQENRGHPSRVTIDYTLRGPDYRYYYLKLEGISFKRQEDTITPNKFDIIADSDIIVDSGRYMTLLNTNIYTHLEILILSGIGVTLTAIDDPTGTFDLCFENLVGITLPRMIFHFRDAIVELKRENTFVEHNGLTCLAVAPYHGPSIFGNIAQSNFLVEYDLRNKKISFTPTQCSRF